jgi:hypothetical protein
MLNKHHHEVGQQNTKSPFILHFPRIWNLDIPTNKITAKLDRFKRTIGLGVADR